MGCYLCKGGLTTLEYIMNIGNTMSAMCAAWHKANLFAKSAGVMAAPQR